ncbi:hypothetical protein CEXT_356451 [Caerostris extrusa]|uniref:Uncharacterized protein n=1 Tax=Caerostris extrusa TaxID=172846 RepID=A0AAV4XSF1_CAEEX|nr:hypothetical protein CEXT_356451 [Caerostris extrusa]
MDLLVIVIGQNKFCGVNVSTYDGFMNKASSFVKDCSVNIAQNIPGVVDSLTCSAVSNTDILATADMTGAVTVIFRTEAVALDEARQFKEKANMEDTLSINDMEISRDIKEKVINCKINVPVLPEREKQLDEDKNDDRETESTSNQHSLTSRASDSLEVLNSKFHQENSNLSENSMLSKYSNKSEYFGDSNSYSSLAMFDSQSETLLSLDNNNNNNINSPNSLFLPDQMSKLLSITSQNEEALNLVNVKEESLVQSPFSTEERNLNQGIASSIFEMENSSECNEHLNKLSVDSSVNTINNYSNLESGTLNVENSSFYQLPQTSKEEISNVDNLKCSEDSCSINGIEKADEMCNNSKHSDNSNKNESDSKNINSTYESLTEKYGLIFKNVKSLSSDDEKKDSVPDESHSISAINTLSWNPNKGCESCLFIAGNSGIAHIIYVPEIC